MNETILELKNACYSYDAQNNALDQICVQIKKSQKIAVLGSNGSGKSTFFLCLNGVYSLNSGAVYLWGEQLKTNKRHRYRLQKSVGYVFQDPDHQMIASTVESEISFGLMNMGVPKEEIKARTDQAIELFNLSQYRKKPPHYLSGGEKKRVTIADILVMKPEILLLDEPTAFLDAKNSEKLEYMLNQTDINKLTIMISTHDSDFAWRWAERIIVFHQGKIVGDGSPDAIFSNNRLIGLTAIKRPALFEITNIVCQSRGVSLPQAMPKNLQQFETWISEIERKRDIAIPG